MKTQKKFIFSSVAFLIFLVTFFLNRLNEASQKPPVNPNNSNSSSSTIETSASSSGSAIFKVVRVIDGDTIEIENGEKVRYIGIDTPEIVDPRKPVQCFGAEASKKNKELVEGKMVRLEKDVTDKDKYGRLLRYVWVDNLSTGSGQALFVNLELVKQGFATSSTYPPNVKYQKEFLAAEKEAKESKRGLWGACPLSN